MKLSFLTVVSAEHNPILELARKTGTEVHSWSPKTLIVDTNGILLDNNSADRALQTVWKILEEALEYSKSESEQIDNTKSLYDFFEDQCERALRDRVMSKEEADVVLRMSEMWGAYVGVRVQRQSLKYFFLEDCISEGWLSLVCAGEVTELWHRRLFHSGELQEDLRGDRATTRRAGCYQAQHRSHVHQICQSFFSTRAHQQQQFSFGNF